VLTRTWAAKDGKFGPRPDVSDMLEPNTSLSLRRYAGMEEARWAHSSISKKEICSTMSPPTYRPGMPKVSEPAIPDQSSLPKRGSGSGDEKYAR
jgi:hypothetical protein